MLLRQVFRWVFGQVVTARYNAYKQAPGLLTLDNNNNNQNKRWKKILHHKH